MPVLPAAGEIGKRQIKLMARAPAAPAVILKTSLNPFALAEMGHLLRRLPLPDLRAHEIRCGLARPILCFTDIVFCRRFLLFLLRCLRGRLRSLRLCLRCLLLRVRRLHRRVLRRAHEIIKLCLRIAERRLRRVERRGERIEPAPVRALDLLHAVRHRCERLIREALRLLKAPLLIADRLTGRSDSRLPIPLHRRLRCGGIA